MPFLTPPGLNMNGTYQRDTRTPPRPNMDALANEYQAIIESERRRHEFVENLMHAIQTLTSEREEARRKADRLDVTCDSYQTRLETAERKIDELQKAIDCDRFVLVLVDGDNTLFLDDYVRDGAAGGERAARDLRQSILDHLKDKAYFQHDYKIMIRVYANLQGLSKTYNDARIIPSSKVFLDFVQTFNKTHELVEFVDAGNDKEAADSKIKATFNLYRRNLHCKQILFSGSGDNSYAGFLRQYVPVDGVSQDITLIESLPFATYLEQLSHKFQTANFPRVFRDSKIVVSTRLSTLEPNKPAFIPMQQNTPPQTWATASLKAALPAVENKENVPPPSTSIQPTVQATPKSAVTGPFIYQNNKAQRIDKPINKDMFDKDVVYNLKPKKLCNKFWLLGKCDQGEWCTHDHKGPLSAKQKENLKFVARMRPCPEELECADPDCFNGHRCQYGMSCTKKDCWFSLTMHEVELTAPVKVPVRRSDYEGYWEVAT